jgi:3-phenylpropionate/trans-cinnamate dioxygenase ferredoxin subunit
MARFRVASLDDLALESLTRVEADGTPICLARTADGELHAINDICSHEDWSLSEGELIDHEVECMKHGSRFDLRTGEPNALPAVDPVPVYAVSVEDGDVYVEV